MCMNTEYNKDMSLNILCVLLYIHILIDLKAWDYSIRSKHQINQTLTSIELLLIVTYIRLSVSVAVIIYHDTRSGKLRMKGFISTSNSQIIPCHWGKLGQSKAEIRGQNLKLRSWRSAAYWLAFMAQFYGLACCFYFILFFLRFNLVSL